MNEEALVNRRIADWNRLETLCSKADMRVSSLTNAEISEFVKLYKKVSTDLSTIRTRSSNEPLTLYLNNLVGRAHGIIYTSPKAPLGKAVQNLIVECARTFRRNKPFFWVSFLIFFGSWAGVYGLLHYDRSFLDFFTGGMEGTFDGWKSGEHDGRSAGESVGASFFYAGNNPRVSIITGAIGAGTMGIYSIMMLFQNGAIIGALSSEMSSVGKLPFLLGSISPHGVPELSGIIFSGAAGLRFGWAILNPGLYSRGESLRRSAKDGVTMIVIGVLLCFIAAPIEGFFSFNPYIPMELKVTFTVIELAMWFGFWTFYGREQEVNESPVESQ